MDNFLQRFPVSPKEYFEKPYFRGDAMLPDWYSKVNPKRFVIRKFIQEALSMVVILALAGFLVYQLLSIPSVRQLVRNPIGLLNCCFALIILSLRLVRHMVEWSLVTKEKSLQHLSLYRIFESPSYSIDKYLDRLYWALLFSSILLGSALYAAMNSYPSISPYVTVFGLLFDLIYPIALLTYFFFQLRREAIIYRYAVWHLYAEPLEGEFSGSIRS